MMSTTVNPTLQPIIDAVNAVGAQVTALATQMSALQAEVRALGTPAQASAVAGAQTSLGQIYNATLQIRSQVSPPQ